jgi:hypothetical protein
MLLTDLQKLRVSVAQIAQVLGATGTILNVTRLPYAALCALAQTQERGWNDLAHACAVSAGTHDEDF